MAELTWAALCTNELGSYLDNQERRKTTARKLPELIARHLAELDEAERVDLAARALNEWWPTALARSQDARNHAWPELLSALAVALTLLHGEAPATVAATLHIEPAIMAQYQKALLPFQRFVLLVADRCEPVRLFVTRLMTPIEGEATPLVDIENSPALSWCLIPSRVFGERSHTGMLALCVLERDRLLRLPTDRPFAATAEIDENGQTLKPVDHLFEKRRGFHTQFPDGVLLSAPPRAESADEWKSLLSNGRLQSSVSDVFSAFVHPIQSQEARTRTSGDWLCAGSIDEAKEKLHAIQGNPEQHGLFEPLRSWDGSEILAATIISVAIRDHYTDRQKIEEIRQQDFLFNLCWSLRYAAARRPRVLRSQDDQGSDHLPMPSSFLHRSHSLETPEEREAALEELTAPMFNSLASHRRKATPAIYPQHQEDDSIIARGAIIYGGPGSGKSIWSQCLTSFFVRGALGTLGMAVRTAARRLAQACEGISAEASLLDVLSKLYPSRASLIKRLHDQQRLFIIIDGLDEISAASLAHIGWLLQSCRALFIATTRDTHHSLDSFPPYLRYRIQPIDVEHVSHFLQAMGRSDLHAQLCTKETYGPLKFRGLSSPVQALCETPLMLALLCSVVRHGETLSTIRNSDLYERTFKARLTRAVTEKGLSEQQVEILRRTVAKVLGELARDWLLSRDGYITDAAIIACLEYNDITGQNAIRYQQALEHGNLLVPGDSRREFAHKTLAEWSAAHAIELDVQRHVTRTRSESGVIDWAKLEIESIDRLIGTQTTLHDSPLRQTMLFFISWSRVPLALIRRAIQPASSQPSHKDNDVFTYARELALQAKWADGDAARLIWALLVRRDLFPMPDESEESDDGSRYHFAVPKIDGGSAAPIVELTQRLGLAIPNERPALVALVSNSEEQRAVLEEDLTLLLPYCTKQQAPAFSALLTNGSPPQISHILAYYEHWQIPLSATTLDRLCHFAFEAKRLAAENWARVDKLYRDRGPVDLAEFEIRKTRRESERRSSRYDLSAASDCEARVYSICAALDHLPPRALLHRDLIEWPGHLTNALTRILENLALATSDVLCEHLLVLLDEQSARAQIELDLLARIIQHPLREALASAMYQQTLADDEDRSGRTHWYHFSELAKLAGWEIPHSRSDRTVLQDDADRLWHRMLSAMEDVEHAQRFLQPLLTALISTPDFCDRAEALWTEWPQEPPYPAKLISGFKSAGKIPACIDLALLVENLQADDFANQKLFSPTHAEALSELAEHGIGRIRFCSLIWKCSAGHAEQLAYWEPYLSEVQDPELVKLVKARIRRMHLSAMERARLFPEEANAVEVLAEHVRLKRPGWEDKLLAALRTLSSPLDEGAAVILRMVEESKLVAAVPELRRMVLIDNSKSHYRLPNLLLELDPQPPPAVIDAILRNSTSQLPDAIFAHLQSHHVPILLQCSGLPGHSEQSRRLTRLKDLSTEHLGAVQQRLIELQTEEAEIKKRVADLKEQRKWEEVRRLDEQSRKIEPWLNLLECWAFHWHCKLHATLEDLCSYLEKNPCGRLKDQIAPLLKMRLDGNDALLPLQGLLRHSKEFVRELAFKELLPRTAPRAQVDLIITALTEHLAYSSHEGDNPTRPPSRWHSYSEPEKESEAKYGHTAELLKQLRRRLNVAHRAAFQRLAESEYPLLRARAASWLKEVGAPTSLPLVRKLIGDSHPEVCAAALRAFEALTLPGERESILDCDRSAWTSSHQAQLIRWLHFGRSPLPYNENEFRDTKRSSPPIESTALLAPLLRDALSAFAKETALRRSDNVSGFMQAVARWEILAARLDTKTISAGTQWLSDDELFAVATDAPEPVRAALYRRLISRCSPRAVAAIPALLQSEDLRERILGAECQLRRGVPDEQKTVFRIWEAAFRGKDKYSIHTRSEDASADFSSDDRSRLARALPHAAREHIDLLALIAGQITEHQEYDDEDGGGETYVNDPEAVKILQHLVRQNGLPAALAVLRGILPDTQQQANFVYSGESFEWAAGVFSCRRDLLPQILPLLEPHTKQMGLRNLYQTLSTPTSDEEAVAEQQYLRSEILPAGWGEESDNEGRRSLASTNRAS